MTSCLFKAGKTLLRLRGTFLPLYKLKHLYIIAGCNGAGKTTASYTILPDILDCKEFVNADEIARGISPFNPSSATFAAGRMMIERINHLIKSEQSFALETTLATKAYLTFIKRAKRAGYRVTLLFFWLNSIELAIERVRIRVMEGGHHIPSPVIKRRYINGLNNFFDLYLDKVDNWLLFDNSGGEYKLIAEGNGTNIEINNKETWNQLR